MKVLTCIFSTSNNTMNVKEKKMGGRLTVWSLSCRWFPGNLTWVFSAVQPYQRLIDRKHTTLSQLQGCTVALPNKGHDRHNCLKTYLPGYLQAHQMITGKQVTWTDGFLQTGGDCRGRERRWSDLECGYWTRQPLNTNTEAFTLVIEKLGMRAEGPTTCPCQDFQDHTKPARLSLPDFPRRAPTCEKQTCSRDDTELFLTLLTATMWRQVYLKHTFGKKIYQNWFTFTDLYNIHSFVLIQGNEKKMV